MHAEDRERQVPHHKLGGKTVRRRLGPAQDDARSVDKTFTGDLDGEGHVEYLMVYRNDGTATFVGLERIIGRFAGQTGSFVLQHTGVFEDGQAKASYSVVAGSGTGSLRSLRGAGTCALGHASDHPFALTYDLE